MTNEATPDLPEPDIVSYQIDATMRRMEITSHSDDNLRAYALAAAAERDAEIERLKDDFERLREWADAYPVEVFKEPDFKRVNQVLDAAGLSLTAVSASNFRYVLNLMKLKIDNALQGAKDA